MPPSLQHDVGARRRQALGPSRHRGQDVAHATAESQPGPGPGPAATPSHASQIPPDAWDLKRAALFLGISPKTLQRYVAKRAVPCILFPSARTDSDRPIIVFDPAELAAWRDAHKVGRMRRAG